MPLNYPQLLQKTQFIIFFVFLVSSVYSQSIVGKDWVCVTEHAEFPERIYFLSLVFKGQIWVVGGIGKEPGFKHLKDVWCSSDGIKWVRKTDRLPFEVNYRSTAVIFNNKIWIGTQTPALNGKSPYQIWSSVDGINWSQSEFDSLPLSKGCSLSMYSALAYKNKMWLIGGRTQPYLKDDVWTSSDGLSWTRTARRKVMKDGPAIVFKDKMWVFSGFTKENHLVWCSEDGVVWKQSEESNFPGHRNGCGVVDFDGKIWLIGGELCHGTYLRDVWNSSDGVHWNQILEKALFAKRQYTRSVEFLGKIWIIGGDGMTGPRNDVWCSP
jgi:hypothetical protein